MSHLVFEESSSNPMKANELLQGLANAARDNPVPAALLGVGLLWVLGRDIAARVGAGEPARTRPRSLGPDIDQSDPIHVSTVEKAAQGVRRAQSDHKDLCEEQPLVVGAVGLAIGAGLASLFPATSIETEFLGPQAECVAATTKRFIAERNP
jgi:hypothetical protein